MFAMRGGPRQSANALLDSPSVSTLKANLLSASECSHSITAVWAALPWIVGDGLGRAWLQTGAKWFSCLTQCLGQRTERNTGALTH